MKKVFISLMAILSLTLFTTSCKKDSTSTGGGGTTPAPTASFTTAVTNLVVVFTNTSTNSKSYSWNFGDNSPASTATSPTYTYAMAGTYTVVLTVTGNDNSTKTFSSSVTVTSGSVAAGPNLLVGGDFSDTTHWTRYPIYTGVNVAYSGNSAVWTGGNAGTGGGHYGIYQAVTVTAGKTYQLDMQVKHDSLFQVWFEVYVSDTIPDPTTANGGNDYNYGGKRLDLNAWDCGNSYNVLSPLSTYTQLSTVTCNDANFDVITTPGYYGTAWNKMSFPSSMFGGASTGTVYIMIRAGGNNFSMSTGYTGISVTNVDFHALN